MKIFVIDTNVILNDPECVFKFEENFIIIDMSVLCEIDKVKIKNEEIGRSARHFSRYLENIIKENGCSVNDGLIVNNKGGRLLFTNSKSDCDLVDDQLISLIKDIKNNKYNMFFDISQIDDVVLVTDDINLRLKCFAFGITAQPFLNNLVNNSFAPIKVIEVDKSIVENFYKNNNFSYSVSDLSLGSYCNFVSIDGGNVLCRVAELDNDGNAILKKINCRKEVFDIKPKNNEQRCLLHALLDPNIQLVICNGSAGTGKTLLSIAAGLDCIENKLYTKMLLLKAIMPFGRDIGYLKGDLMEKMKQWLLPFYDNLEYIYTDNNRTSTYSYLIENGIIEIDALTYIRGRSLPNRFIIIDEAQNLTQKEIKTIVTRVGEGSKIVLLGDVQQIDNPYLNKHNNGLAYVMDRMLGLSNVAILNIYKSERSLIATQALERL